MSPQDEADLRRLILAEFRRNEFVSSTCQGKERFESFSMADRIAKTMSYKRSTHIMAYRCHVCSGWHIGSRQGDSPVTARSKKERKARLEAYS